MQACRLWRTQACRLWRTQAIYLRTRSKQQQRQTGVRSSRHKPGRRPAPMPARFCRNCSNLLYPQEDKEYFLRERRRRLLYVCRTCAYREVVQNLAEPVHRHVVHHSASEKTTVRLDAPLDPTLPRTHHVTCAKCGHHEAVYFQSPVGRNDEALVLVFICVHCKNTWLSSDEQ